MAQTPPYFSLARVVLALAYPPLAHLAIASHSNALALGAIGLLAAFVLLPPLARGQPLAWLALPAVIAVGWVISRAHAEVLMLYLPPVLIPAFVAWIFGHTLAPGKTPLIEQLVRLLHPPEQEQPTAEVWSYARRLTVAWTALLTALAAINLLLAALAEPGGLLLSAGIAPPLTVPQRWWSLFANLIGNLLVAAFFVIEYAYRRRRFPEQPYRNMLDFFRKMIAAGPRLFARGE